MAIRKNAKRRFQRRRKSNNGYIFWNLVAAMLMIISIVGLYFVLGIRVEQGYFTADPIIMLLDHVFYALLTATFIGWLVGIVIRRTKKR